MRINCYVLCLHLLIIEVETIPVWVSFNSLLFLFILVGGVVSAYQITLFKGEENWNSLCLPEIQCFWSLEILLCEVSLSYQDTVSQTTLKRGILFSQVHQLDCHVVNF